MYACMYVHWLLTDGVTFALVSLVYCTQFKMVLPREEPPLSNNHRSSGANFVLR